MKDDFWLGKRHTQYTAVATWVRDHALADASFMAAEVGTLGYLTHLRMIDPFGLIGETNDFASTNSAGAWFDLMARFKPDLVLVDSLAIARSVEQVTGYRIVKVFPWRQPRSVLLVRAALVLRGDRATR
jgi:hypothetical protein